jgi:rhodanese-related sulfurtransferase
MRTILFAVVAAAFCFFSCDNKASSAKMTGLAGSMQDSTLIRLWPREIDSLLKTNPNIPFIDVRSEMEFQAAHIYRSMNCSFDAPDFAQRIIKLDVNAPVILYDNDSSVSLKAAETMRQLGFKRIYELCGGLFSWARDGKTMVSGESKIDSSTILK